MSFFNMVAILGVFVFTPYAGATSKALADEGSGSASRGEQLQVVVAPREAVVDEDVSRLSEGQRAVEDMMQSMRNEWEAESGWGWIPPQQPRKRSGDTVVKGMSPQERMVKMLQFDFAPLVEDILLSNAQRLAAVAAVAPDVPEESSAAKSPLMVKAIDKNNNSDAANQSANLELDQVVKKVVKATERKVVHGGATPPVGAGAGASAKTKEMTAQVTADIVRHFLRRADIAPNVSASEMAATTERELEALEQEQQATSPAPTPLGEVIRKVARVTADFVKKMQKRNLKAKHGKRHAQQQKDHPITITTPSTESHTAEAAVVAAAASAVSYTMDKTKDSSLKDIDSSPKDTESSTVGKKKRGSELLAANSDILEKISLRRDADPVAKDNGSDPTFAQKLKESVQLPPFVDPSKTKEASNSIATSTGDAGKVIPGSVELSASIVQPGEVKLIAIEAGVDERRPERMAEVLEMDGAMDAADSDLDRLRFAYESPLMKEAAPLNERNKRKLDGNLFEESLKDMGGEIHDRASAIQENRMNLMERNAMFPTIEETLKDLVERAIEENLLSAQRSFLSDIGLNESGSGATKEKDEQESKSDNRKVDQHSVSLAKDKRADTVVSNKTGNGNASTKGFPHKETRMLEIKGAYWRVPEKENGVTSSSKMARAADVLKLKRQTKDKVSDTSTNLSQNNTETVFRDIGFEPFEDREAPPSSNESANSSEEEHPLKRDTPLLDEFSLKETAEKGISGLESNVSDEKPLEKAKRDDDEHDIGNINFNSPVKKLDDSKLDGIEKTEISDTSGVDLPETTDISGTLQTNTVDGAVKDGSKNMESASEEEDTGNPRTSTEDHEEYLVDADAPRGGEGGGGGGGGEEDATDDQLINDTAESLEYQKGYGRASTNGLLCYQCRSDKTSDCGGSDPPKKWLKECKFDEPPERPVCRMIKREIVTSSGKKDLVLRMCGSSSASSEGGCYESLWGEQTTCECMTNACNGAVSALKRAASLSNSGKTLMQGQEREFQSSGTNAVPWSFTYAAMPLATILSSCSALFVY